jgi:hypothetical protein
MALLKQNALGSGTIAHEGTGKPMMKLNFLSGGGAIALSTLV